MKNIIFICSIFTCIFLNLTAFAESEHYVFCSKAQGLNFSGDWVFNANQNSYIKASGNWIKNKIFQTTNCIENLKAECSKLFGETDTNKIHVTTKDSKFSKQYPIISFNSPEPISGKKIKNIKYKDVLDYPFILSLAYASRYTYLTEMGNNPEEIAEKSDILKKIDLKSGYQLIPNSVLITKVANIYSAAFINEKDKVIIVAYKGTSNYKDILIDAEFSLSNEIHLPLLNKAIDEALQSYKETLEIVKREYKNPELYKVVLTGHSLGAFYASIVAVNQNLPARVFSLPATYFKENTSYTNLFNFFNNIPFYYNVINFVRYEDPVNTLSGRHVENKIYFDASDKFNILKNHYLMNLIEDILEKEIAPHYFELLPTYSNFKMNDNSYFGIKKLINFKGNTPLSML